MRLFLFPVGRRQTVAWEVLILVSCMYPVEIKYIRENSEQEQRIHLSIPANLLHQNYKKDGTDICRAYPVTEQPFKKLFGLSQKYIAADGFKINSKGH
jgi:hypothetical protein